MKATIKQLQKIEFLKTGLLLNVVEYGHFSDGSIGVLCCDCFGEFLVSIDSNGTIIY